MNRHPRAALIAAAVADRDGDGLAAHLADHVRLRALLPGGPIEEQGRERVLARFAGWFADMDTVELADAAGELVADRLLVHYRLDLRRGGHRLACTQTAVCTLDDGRLTAIDLLCSGIRRI